MWDQVDISIETGGSWAAVTILRLSSTARCDYDMICYVFRIRLSTNQNPNANKLSKMRAWYDQCVLLIWSSIIKVASVEVNDDKTVTVGYLDGQHLKPKGNLVRTKTQERQF